MLNFWISLIPVTEYWPAKPYFAVPLVTIFTKFDGQIIAEYVKLNVIENTEDRWEKARENAEISFQTVYLPKVLNTEHPPKAYVQLQGEPENGDHFLAQLRKYSPMIDLDIPENNCPELTEKTSDAIDDSVLKALFISTQRNNLDLSVKSTLQWESCGNCQIMLWYASDLFLLRPKQSLDGMKLLLQFSASFHISG